MVCKRDGRSTAKRRDESLIAMGGLAWFAGRAAEMAGVAVGAILCWRPTIKQPMHIAANGSFTTDAFSTRADQCPLLLQWRHYCSAQRSELFGAAK
jgi:hypothetical protein